MRVSDVVLNGVYDHYQQGRFCQLPILKKPKAGEPVTEFPVAGIPRGRIRIGPETSS
jgi:hypothetical protein